MLLVLYVSDALDAKIIDYGISRSNRKIFSQIIDSLVQTGEHHPDVVFVSPYLSARQCVEDVKSKIACNNIIVDPEIGRIRINDDDLATFEKQTARYFPVRDKSINSFRKRVIFRLNRLRQISERNTVWIITHKCVASVIAEMTDVDQDLSPGSYFAIVPTVHDESDEINDVTTEDDVSETSRESTKSSHRSEDTPQSEDEESCPKCKSLPCMCNQPLSTFIITERR